MYRALCRTVEEDLQVEVEFLLGFDRARTRLNDLYDWPGQSLDLFVRVAHQNDNKLSKTKRGSHFDWMTDEEIRTSEAIVAAEFQQRQKWSKYGMAEVDQARTYRELIHAGILRNLVMRCCAKSGQSMQRTPYGLLYKTTS
jgi:hypothetical protein